MQFFDRFKKVKLSAYNPQFLNKYEQPFFKDKALQDEIKRKGYAVRDLLNADSVEALNASFKEIASHPEFEMSGLFWSSGRSSSTAIRNLAKHSIDQFIKPSLISFFHEDVASLIGGVFVAKPPSASSALSPHQDSSHVDETVYMSVYAWCALSDTNLQNGAVYILPGSHFFGNIHRSLNIPWQFEPYKELMWKYCIPIPMKAGQVLFFDSATIHCSPPNNSQQLRLGANFFIQPKSAPFTHYFRDEKTPQGMIEKYEVSIDFYYNEDFESRPPEKYPFLGMEPYRDLQLTANKVHKLCKAAVEKAHQI